MTNFNLLSHFLRDSVRTTQEVTVHSNEGYNHSPSPTSYKQLIIH